MCDFSLFNRCDIVSVIVKRAIPNQCCKYLLQLQSISYHSPPRLLTTHRQISGDASTPLFRILSAFEGSVKSTVTSAEDGSVTIGLPAEEPAERNPLQIMGKLKASAMRCVRTVLKVIIGACLVRLCVSEMLCGWKTIITPTTFSVSIKLL
jgi:hypothetical protein